MFPVWKLSSQTPMKTFEVRLVFCFLVILGSLKITCQVVWKLKVLPFLYFWNCGGVLGAVLLIPSRNT